jgi:dTDP-glucose 4,6-dehydratase
MRVLITGGNGFVGINIINEIINSTDWEIVCYINKNFNNIPENIHKIYDLTKQHFFDIIIHAGGDPSSKSCIDNPKNGVIHNINFTFEILEYARLNNIKKILFLSSCEVYGHANEKSSETDLLISYNMYGASKVACEHMCSAYYHSYGISTTAIRLINTFGPFCQEERFPSIIKNKFKTEKIPHFILSNKSKKRWLDIQEMAKRIVFIIKNMPIGFEVFNFVGDENISLIDLVNKLSDNKPFTYEFFKEDIVGYNHEGNANGDKFLEFYKLHSK